MNVAYGFRKETVVDLSKNPTIEAIEVLAVFPACVHIEIAQHSPYIRSAGDVNVRPHNQAESRTLAAREIGRLRFVQLVQSYSRITPWLSSPTLLNV
jgi:hypothetical protein